MGQDDSRSSHDASTTGGTDAVPNIPSTQPYNHNATILMDSIDEALSKRGILAVCNRVRRQHTQATSSIILSGNSQSRQTTLIPPEDLPPVADAQTPNAVN